MQSQIESAFLLRIQNGVKQIKNIKCLIYNVGVNEPLECGNNYFTELCVDISVKKIITTAVNKKVKEA